ncbi:hypothetical protein NPIL_321661, partial [Nephila pilipes]
MCPCALRKIFETTDQLGILPGTGRKQIPSFSFKNVATAIIKASRQHLPKKMTTFVRHLKDSIRCHVLNNPSDSDQITVGNMVHRLQHIVENE